jgi:hypothetical protein
MNGQLKLSVEQVIVAIEMLSPAEKRKIKRRLPDLLGMPEYSNLPGVELGPASTGLERQPVRPNDFLESRKLLREIQGTLSADVIADREDRL